MGLHDRQLGIDVLLQNIPRSLGDAIQLVRRRKSIYLVWPAANTAASRQPRIRFACPDTFSDYAEEDIPVLSDVCAVRTSPATPSQKGRAPQSPNRTGEQKPNNSVALYTPPHSNQDPSTFTVADLVKLLQQLKDSKRSSNGGERRSRGNGGSGRYPRNPVGTVPTGSYVCFNCDIPGHYREHCLLPEKAKDSNLNENRAEKNPESRSAR